MLDHTHRRPAHALLRLKYRCRGSGWYDRGHSTCLQSPRPALTPSLENSQNDAAWPSCAPKLFCFGTQHSPHVGLIKQSQDPCQSQTLCACRKLNPTNISIAAIPSARLRRNVLQPWDGGSLRLAMYLATLVCPISMPSLRSSPWIRGAPHRGLAMLISRISLRISGATVGRPPRRRDFHRQYDLNPARCHLITVSGFTIAKAPAPSEPNDTRGRISDGPASRMSAVSAIAAATR